MQAEVTLWPTLTNVTGVRREQTWESVFAELEAQPGPHRGDLHPGWSAAVFSGDRRNLANVERVTAMVLDCDGSWSLGEAVAALSEWYGIIHTSRRHTADVNRFRVVLPLSRPVSRFEHAAMWRRFDARFPGRIDQQAKDASRFWYLPGMADGATFETRRLHGQPLDPDAVLEWPEPSAPQAPTADNSRIPVDARERASRYLAKMPEAISGQAGHAATFEAALALVKGFGLSDESALALLLSEYNPRCTPVWTERELRHKVESAAKSSKVPDGYLLKNDRVREPSPQPHVDEQTPEAAAARVEETEDEQLAAEPAERDGEPPQTAAERFGVQTLRQLIGSVWERSRAQEPVRFVSACHAEIDRSMRGFRGGHVAVLGAITSWGKSSYAVMVADEAAERQQTVLIVTCEDVPEVYATRFTARRTGINAMRIGDNYISEEERTRVGFTADSAPDTGVMLNAIGMTIEKVADAIRQLGAEQQIDLVILDYLQAASTEKKTQDRRNEITHIARTFTDAVKSIGAAGLILSQFKRLEKPGTKPTRNDLKESGDIENMAEHILLGWCEDGEHQVSGEREVKRWIVLDKNKDGPVSSNAELMPFDNKTASFRVVR